MSERLKIEFPWEEPESVYYSAGPQENVEFKTHGHHFLIQLASKTGFHTGRRCYHVTCLTCGIILHEATTGPGPNIRMHLEHMGVRA